VFPDRLKPGIILDNRYEIRCLIKAGGMGAVYEALDHRFNKTSCAVKEMLLKNPNPEEQQYIIKRFQREAEILHTLRHANLPVVRDYFTEYSRYYIVMDYIEGSDLSSIIKRFGAIPQEQVIEWSIQILDALDYLHSQPTPIIYRDLKPGNIMIRNSDKRAMLVDFGIARTIELGSDTIKTVVGTLVFAPEELLQGKVEPRSDIYSLGGTMHCMLSGIIPTGAFSFEPLRHLKPNVCEELEWIVMRALKMKASQRYDTAKDMKEALECISNLDFAGVSRTNKITGEKQIPLLVNEATISLDSYNEGKAVPPTVKSPELKGTIPSDPEIIDEKMTIRKKIEISEDKVQLPEKKLSTPTRKVESSGKSVKITKDKKDFTRIFVLFLVFTALILSLIIIYVSSRIYKACNLCQKGQDFYSKGAYDEAIKYYDLALKINPDYVKALNGKGMAFNSKKEYHKAIECYDKALKIAPKDMNLMYNKGFALYNQDKYDLALKCYDKILQIDTKNDKVLVRKADVLYSQGKYDEAIKCYDNVLTYKQNDLFSLYNKGNILNEQRKYKEALECYEKVLALDPDYLDTKNKKENVLKELDN